jgi:hypothetical protein
MPGLVGTKEASDGHHDPSTERQGGLRRAEIGSRVQNGYVSPGTGGYARPPQERKNRPVSSNKVSARAREWTRVPYSSFPRNEGVPGSSPGVGFSDLQGFSVWTGALMKGSGVYQRSTLVKGSGERANFAGCFSCDSVRETFPAVVISSHPQSPRVQIDPISGSEGIHGD